MASSSSENKEPKRSSSFNLSPNDRELVQLYLLNKILNHPPPNGHVIDTFDLYSHHPERLPFKEMEYSMTETEMCVFMENREEYRESVITVDGGVWVQVGAEQPVYRKKIVIGFRKDRIFERGISTREMSSKWMVNEFRVNFAALPSLADNDDMKNEANKWVACRIIKTPKWSKVKRGSMHINSDVDRGSEHMDDSNCKSDDDDDDEASDQW